MIYKKSITLLTMLCCFFGLHAGLTIVELPKSEVTKPGKCRIQFKTVPKKEIMKKRNELLTIKRVYTIEFKSRGFEHISPIKPTTNSCDSSPLAPDDIVTYLDNFCGEPGPKQRAKDLFKNTDKN